VAQVGDAEGDLELDLLRATAAELESALARVRAAQDNDRQFLADAAHQLRTPIAGIRACAEALLRGSEGEQAGRLFASLVRESSRLTRLEADLRTLARLDDGEQLRPRTADVVGLCKDEISRVWSLAPQLDVVLRAPALSWPAQVDDRAVRETLANLLDNARRHAHSRIDVVITPGRDWIELRVDDDGPGVADDAVEAVFGRFVSLDGLGGSGLGLPIARDLARACGGDLSYDRGFVLTLPVTVRDI
jgi:signal transduction histidine kinase